MFRGKEKRLVSCIVYGGGHVNRDREAQTFITSSKFEIVHVKVFNIEPGFMQRKCWLAILSFCVNDIRRKDNYILP